MMPRPSIAAILVFLPSAFGQGPVEFTAKIGVPITDSLQTGTIDFLATGLHQGSSATRRYTAGVGIVVRLPHSFGAEVDFLRTHLDHREFLGVSAPGNVPLLAFQETPAALRVFAPGPGGSLHPLENGRGRFRHFA